MPPASASAAVPGAWRPARRLRCTGMNRDLLVVDDGACCCWAVRQALERWDWRVTTTASVVGARALLAQASFAVVLTDLRLPGESGLDLLRWMRTARRRTPGLVASAYVTAPGTAELLAAGAATVLAKPLDLRLLLRAASRLAGVADQPPETTATRELDPVAGVDVRAETEPLAPIAVAAPVAASGSAPATRSSRRHR